MCGGESGVTSNNRMELTAPIMALEALTRPVTVHLYTDSTYVRNGITKWVLGWERNGWMTAAKQPVKNAELWQALDEAAQRHKIKWHWVKGHAGHAENERADELARMGMAPFKKGRGGASGAAAPFASKPAAAPRPAKAKPPVRKPRRSSQSY